VGELGCQVWLCGKWLTWLMAQVTLNRFLGSGSALPLVDAARLEYKNITGLSDIKMHNHSIRASHLRNTEISDKCFTWQPCACTLSPLWIKVLAFWKLSLQFSDLLFDNLFKEK